MTYVLVDISLFSHFEILVMHIADGNGIASEIHDKLAVAQNAHDITFLAGHDACQDTKFDVVFGEFDEGIAKEGYSLGLRFHHFHEGFHDTILNGSGLTCHAIVDEMIAGEILLEEASQLVSFPLKENQATDGRFLFLLHALAIGLLLIVYGAMDETFGYEISFEVIFFESFVERSSSIMLDEKIAPRGFLFFTSGYSFYFWSRFFISPNYTDALW